MTRDVEGGVGTNLLGARGCQGYEHEKIAEKLGHIPAKTTECLIAGLPSEFNDTRQQVVYRVHSCDVAGVEGVVPLLHE